MKISVCSEALFMGKDYAQAMKELANAGFRDIEFWTWWDKDLGVLKALKEEFSLNFVAMCTKFVSLVDRSKFGEFKQGLTESIMAAKDLGCHILIGQTGDELANVKRGVQHGSIVAGLKDIAPLLEDSGVILALEPLNTRVDHIGYYLWDADEAFGIIDEVDSPNIKVLFDIYHQQIMQGDLLRRIGANIDKIGHFHVAGNPGRGDPCTGEVNYPGIARAIDGFGYTGHAGLEYFIKDDVLESLKRCREIFGA
jgi:hydroxypyruvate isomerase